MTPHELIEKWRDTGLRESQGAQEWFVDLCRVVGHPTPAEADKKGESFCFERGVDPPAVARFLDRVVFYLFAEDVGLLPEKPMTELLDQGRKEPASFPEVSATLSVKMADGGYFGAKRVRHFVGHLFDDAATLELTGKEFEGLYHAARQDWSTIDPSIFGTLFERGVNPAKRSQLGLHYTSYTDIETIVEPVVMEPLRREWAAVREPVENLMRFSRNRRDSRNPCADPRGRSGATRDRP